MATLANVYMRINGIDTDVLEICKILANHVMDDVLDTSKKHSFMIQPSFKILEREDFDLKKYKPSNKEITVDIETLVRHSIGETLLLNRTDYDREKFPNYMSMMDLSAFYPEVKMEIISWVPGSEATEHYICEGGPMNQRYGEDSFILQYDEESGDINGYVDKPAYMDLVEVQYEDATEFEVIPVFEILPL